ncbi:related to Probable carboxypeptidase AO090003000058 [Lecanosticta acicola]|uniref:Related to Probable carboxypeptidase AO090003000058 n=1 Tax=Lecanosticta acicola TaxID=111012 RepID=A0AAI8YT71_9PEZI|nr:related to Probable carboxypeptidase AO090003000058 [Lecanosticta acicola]
MKGVELLSLLACISSGLASILPSSQEPLADSDIARHKLRLTHDLVNFHKNLTQIESISGNEKEVGDWLAASLESQGYNVEKQYLSKDPERFNVFAWPGKTRETQVLLTSHIDTVPPFLPYNYNKTNNVIFGRGSVDAKGSVAAQVIALNQLLVDDKVSPDDVSVLYVVGEEVGGVGMRKANDLKLHPKTVIFGEPTEEKLVSGHKGTMQMSFTAKGKSGHSGYPWLGRSANEVLVRALSPLIDLGLELPESDKYGISTFNLGRIEGGVASNVIAESAFANVAVRIASGTLEDIQKSVRNAVKHSLKEFLEGEIGLEDILEIDFGGNGYAPIDLDSDVPGFDVITVNYGTDIPWLNKTVEDQKRYLYGPGTILVAHSADEKLTVGQLEEAVEGYQKIVLHALGKGESEAKIDL